MSLQETRNHIFYTYGVELDDMDARKVEQLISELDEYCSGLEEYETKVQEIKTEVIMALHKIAQKYPTFTITLASECVNFGDLEIDDVEVEE